MLVVDASLAVEMALDERGFTMFDVPMHAPALLWSESTSLVHELQWRGAITPALARAALEAMATAPIEAVSSPELCRQAWQVADELGWAKTYDAEYVALARLLGCPLVTLDLRLRRGARRLADVRTPTEV